MKKTRVLLNAAAAALTWAALSAPMGAECFSNAECEWWPGTYDECNTGAELEEHCHINDQLECHGGPGTCELGGVEG